MTTAALIARWLAIAIAVLGVIDPAVTSMRVGQPHIAVVAAHRVDEDLARSVGDRLARRFTVVTGAWERAAATVVVGTALPDRIPGGLVFAVRDEARRVTWFDVPPAIAADARVTIPLYWQVDFGGGTAELRANGVVVGRDTSRDSGSGAEFTLTPPAAGPLLLQGRFSDRGDTMTVDAMTNVVDRQHAVLFFDRRPSWMSTFVRRSLERDRRFAVASRVITSRGVTTDAGQPPSTLSDPALLELYDVIVIGAPSLLTATDVAGLETFLRRRGGSVLLLYDEVPAPGAHDRLTGVSRWTPSTLRAPVRVATGTDTAAELASELAFPAAPPVGASVHASARVGDTHRPVLWSTGLGTGQVIVSGALDAWKFRDRATSGFDEFWRATVSRAAREAGDAVTVEVLPNIAEPGERLRVKVSLRDTTARPTAVVDSTALALWRGDRAGVFVGELRAPAVGDHSVRVTASGGRAEAPVTVREVVQRMPRSEWQTVELVARGSGGIAGSLDDVERALRERVASEPRMERWWPMRSGWWILPFVTLLGFEWLARRRKGLP